MPPPTSAGCWPCSGSCPAAGPRLKPCLVRMARSTPAPRCRGFRASTGCPAPGNSAIRHLVVIAAAAASGIAAAPASAEVAANVTLSSNQLFRGETISDDDPGATIAVSVDSPSGLFAGADASFAAGGQQPRLTAANLYAGYAKRVGDASLEAGVIHRTYGTIFDEAYRRHFTELYAGVSLRRVQLRVYVSPD